MADDQRMLQSLSDEFSKLQEDLQSTISARQKLESQQQENKSVQKEFSTLAPEANIYKLVGPVLLKQDKNEATMAVNGRLDFIEKEIKRIEGQIKDLQGKNEGKRIALMKLQSEIQQAQHAQQAT